MAGVRTADGKGCGIGTGAANVVGTADWSGGVPTPGLAGVTGRVRTLSHFDRQLALAARLLWRTHARNA